VVSKEVETGVTAGLDANGEWASRHVAATEGVLPDTSPATTLLEQLKVGADG